MDDRKIKKKIHIFFFNKALNLHDGKILFFKKLSESWELISGFCQ